ncbi:MAG: Crp/Fnr family transcriptional regulator [Elusimicrobia bacterium]|nr:Crp/Fnr family transcriptional regulator [Elusimicrobiota bacterium]
MSGQNGDGGVRAEQKACAIAARRGGCSLEHWCSTRGMSGPLSSGFASNWRVNRYARGNVLFYQGNEPFALFFLCSGRVKIVRADREGRRQIVRIIRAPDFIGERSLIARQPYSATAEVMEEADICVIDSAKFFRFWSDQPEFARFLAQRLAITLGDVQGLATDLALRTIRERLAKLIVRQSEVPPQSETVILPTESRQELAELLGTSPEVVCRTLKELSSSRLISVSGRRVRILDGARLRAAAWLPAKPVDFYQSRPVPPSSQGELQSGHNRQRRK